MNTYPSKSMQIACVHFDALPIGPVRVDMFTSNGWKCHHGSRGHGPTAVLTWIIRRGTLAVMIVQSAHAHLRQKVMMPSDTAPQLCELLQAAGIARPAQ